MQLKISIIAGNYFKLQCRFTFQVSSQSMESGFLDDTCTSKSSKSFIKTSTAAKENMKWNEDAFFNRQNLPPASESLFLPSVESSISALSEVTNVLKNSSKKPVFELNDTSLISDGANSSLGILNVENLSDLSGSSFYNLRNSVKKQKPKKLQRYDRVCSEDINSEIKDLNFEEKFASESKKILESLNEVHSEENNTDGSSSSDIEYDGTNIPELNYDFDVLSLIDSKKAYSRISTVNDTTQSRASVVGRNEKNNRESTSCGNSQIMKDDLFKCDSRSESLGNSRQSIFESLQPSYDSLYQQLLSEKAAGGKNKKSKGPQTIKVCPFLGVSSFEVEAILQKQDQSSISSDIEKARYSENLSVDFCPEQISARSSSFKSSMKFELTASDISNKEKFDLSVSSSQHELSLVNEDLGNEVLHGSHLQMPGINFEAQNESSGISENKENSFGEFEEFSDKSLHSNLFPGKFCSFPDEENWCSRLGISESEFFSSEAAKEVLKSDTEAFEKEQMARSLSNNKVSSVSNWSPPNQHEVTAPSWYAELSPNESQSLKRHVSIGTLIRARTENLGSLSGDSESERPYFGTFVTTPPKGRSSSMFSTTSDATDKSSVQESSFRSIRGSALSDILNEISTSDPSKFASKVLEKYRTNVKAPYQSLGATQVNEFKNISIKQHSSLQNEISCNFLSDIEESEDTLVRSASANSITTQNKDDPDGDSKPLTSGSMRCMENSLNFSDVGSTSERESIKTTKSDASSKCSLTSQQSMPQGFSRCTSSCSNACSNPVSLQNAVCVQYGCTQYLNPGQQHNHFMIPNNYLFQQAGSSTLPCSHICGQHMLQPNLLPINAPTSVQTGSALPLHPSNTHLSYFGIQAPTELFFPEKLALGDSQEMNLAVQNTSNVACSYHISCVSAYLNDNPLPFEMSGLSFNKLVPSCAGSITDIKLVLAPRYEGKIKVTLQINAFSTSVGQTLNITPGASVKTKIEYEVVRPFISLLSNGKNTLNLGPVIAGSTFVEYITLINNCEVSVPLRISLSNDSIEDQIYFGLKEMDRQKYPTCGAPRFLSPKVMLYRLPGTKNKSVPSRIDIPIVFESIKGRINSTVTAAVETPTLSEVLAFIKILASTGNANLTLKDPSQNPLILKATKGSTCSHSLTVVNDGTLSVVYDFHIESESDSFLVSPTSVKLQPKESTTISVTFSPLTSEAVKGKLLAAAEPHGQVFSVTDIIGNIQAHSYSLHLNNNKRNSSEPTRDSNNSPILVKCNKKYLYWAGVDIGKTIIKTISVRYCGRETAEVKIFIKDDLQAFQLIDNTSKRVDSYMLTMSYMEDKEISIAFTAKHISSYSSLLCLKIMNQAKVGFTVPLSGYGGSVNIKVPGLLDGEGIGYCLEVEVPNKAETVYKNVTLHNTGLRAAFVKLLLTYNGVVQNPVQKQAVINPSEFVLLENEKKNVLVSLNYVGKNQVSNNEVISVLYGDEILRQALKRKNRSSTFVSNDPVSNINFNLPYDGEDRVPYASIHHVDESFFYSNLKRLMIHIFYGEMNMSFSRMSFASASVIQDSFANLTLNTATPSRRLTINCHSPPVKESSVRNVSRLSLPLPFEDDISLNSTITESSDSFLDGMKNLRLQSWTVQPKELILDADNKDNRILLKSYSDYDMRFKVNWTVDVVTVSPVSGSLSAKGEIGLRLSLISNNHSKLLDDYQGCIKIFCDGMEEIVQVKVRKDQKSTKSTASSLSPRSGFLTESCYLGSTVGESPSSLQIISITNFPRVIELQKTKIGALSEKVLIVQNLSTQSVTWNIQPKSMLLSQPIDVDCSSSSIDFPLSSGVLKSMEATNIVIKFTLSPAAEFMQFFELSLYYEDGKKQSSCVKVHGEVIAEIPSVVKEQTCDARDRKSNITSKEKVKSEIFTDNEICEYPTVAPGQKSTSGIIINNVSSQDYVLNVIKPNLPFILNHSSATVESKKFLRIPVHFKPMKASCYESEVKFISQSGYELKVKLKGTCSA